MLKKQQPRAVSVEFEILWMEFKDVKVFEKQQMSFIFSVLMFVRFFSLVDLLKIIIKRVGLEIW